MRKIETAYTVQQLAKLAGVSVRTLHHYDQIGLLRPSSRSAARYRQYGEKDLLLLQQILFFRELEFPLEDIRRILSSPGFDPLKALASHRKMLVERMERLNHLLITVDKTIQKLTEESMILTDEELYEGFSKEQIERYQREVTEKYDPTLVAESNRRVRKMTKEQWNAVKLEGDAVTREMAALMGEDPASPAVQSAIARHHAWIEHFYPASAEIYRGLGQGYAEHPEFRAFYDRYKPDLAIFMKAAMDYFADHTLEK